MKTKNIMFSLKLKGVSKIGLGALGGVISGGFFLLHTISIDGIDLLILVTILF